MGDPVYLFVSYAVVPPTDCRMTSTAPTRDAVLGSMQLPPQVLTDLDTVWDLLMEVP